MYSSEINIFFPDDIPNRKRYYYLYKVVNTINNHFYYGIHGTENLQDNYAGSGTLLMEAYKKYGKRNFNLYILEFFDNRKDMLARESEIVDVDLVTDPKCYNLIPGGQCYSDDLVPVTLKDGSKTVVKKSEYNRHRENYVGTTKGLVRINKDNINKLINPEELDKYLNEGWSLGQTIKSTKNKIVVTNNSKDIFIYPEELDKYLSEGWHRGGKSRNKGQKSFAKNLIWINDGHIQKRINKSDLNKFLEMGWKSGTIQKRNTNNICINNGVITKQITRTELDKYLSEGWKQGYIRNWTKKTWVHKDGKDRMVSKCEEDKYINDGWIRGRLLKIIPNLGKVSIIKGDLMKYVKLSDLDKYLEDGWIRGSKCGGKNKQNNS